MVNREDIKQTMLDAMLTLSNKQMARSRARVEKYKRQQTQLSVVFNAQRNTFGSLKSARVRITDQKNQVCNIILNVLVALLYL